LVKLLYQSFLKEILTESLLLVHWQEPVL
jgi:hypothetical protein